jgi:hypothetical protein
MPPTVQKRNTLVEHEQILGALRNPVRDREWFTCPMSGQLRSTKEQKKPTLKMSPTCQPPMLLGGGTTVPAAARRMRGRRRYPAQIFPTRRLTRRSALHIHAVPAAVTATRTLVGRSGTPELTPLLLLQSRRERWASWEQRYR